jgi:hypothetical protein
MSVSNWRFTTRVFDAVVARTDGTSIFATLPEVGGMPCRIAVEGLAGTNGQLARATALKRGDHIPVGITLRHLLCKGAFELVGSEVDGQLHELSRRLREKHTVVVEARVIHKMAGALGFVIITQRYRGLTGVVHRINLPGNTVVEQHRFANDAKIDDVFPCRVLYVNPLGTWRVQFGMRDVPSQEADVESAPVPVVTKRKASWDVYYSNLMDGVVERRISADTVELRFKTDGYRTMVCRLHQSRLLGSDDVRRQRFNRLKRGDTVTVTVKLHRVKGGVELRATESYDYKLADIHQSIAFGDRVILNARVLKTHKHSLWAEVTSRQFEGLRGIVRAGKDDASKGVRFLGGAANVGDLVVVRVTDVTWVRNARFPLTFDFRLANEAERGTRWSMCA